jgi:two-component system, LytTR family, response regulator
MQKIKVLITDDEQGSHKILENYIGRLPELELAGNAFNAIEAISFISSVQVDVIFLDITMPELNGFQFLRLLDNPPFIIFTTAHSEFALESYEYNAIDYLKKPIPFERFEKAVNKLKQLLDSGIKLGQLKNDIKVKVDGHIISVPLDRIFYIQSMGNYVKIFLQNRILVTQITTAELEENLPRLFFVRVHKSFIVNKTKIDSITDDEVIIDENKLPIGKTFKKYVRELIL